MLGSVSWKQPQDSKAPQNKTRARFFALIDGRKHDSDKWKSQSLKEKFLQEDLSQDRCHLGLKSHSLPGAIINENFEEGVRYAQRNNRFCMRIEPDKDHMDRRKAALSVCWVYGMITISTFFYLAAPLALDAGPYKTNWWIYAFVQQFSWTCMAVGDTISSFNAALPGMRFSYRFWVYMMGMLTYCGYKLLCHYLLLDNNMLQNTFAVIAPQVPVSICYLYWTICYVRCTENTGLQILDVYTGSYWLERPSFTGRIFRAPLQQYWLVSLYNVLASSTYFTMMRLSVRVQHSKSKISWFFVFCIVNYLMKALLKAVGIMIDMGKGGTYSLFFYGEIISLNFYYVFYRSLFDSVRSFWIFMGFQFVHLLHDWVFYPLRATEWYYNFYKRALKGAGKLQSKVIDALLAPITAKLLFSHRDWCSFITLDYSVRIIIQIYTFVWFLAGFSFLRYGWNSTHFSYYREVDQSQYKQFVLYSVMSVVLELINTFILHHYFFKPRKLEMLPRMQRLFENNLLGWGIIFLTSGQFSDIWLGTTDFTFVY